MPIPPICNAEALESRTLLAGGPISLYTNGFEQPALAPGATSSLRNFGWSIVPNSGSVGPVAWRPSNSGTDFTSVAPLASPADGNQVAEIDESASAFERFYGVIQANTRYTATVAVGDRLNQPLGDWAIELWAGTTRGTSLLMRVSGDDIAAVTAANGAWADNSVSFDSATRSSAVGKALFVRFVNYNGIHPGPVYFDNLRLNVDPPATLTATSSLVEIATPNQKVTFTKDLSGRFQLTTSVNSNGTWQPMFDAQRPVVQGTDFDLVPSSYSIIENSDSRVAVQFSGTHPTRGYNWTMLVEAKAGNDLIHFNVTANLTSALPLTGLEPQPALWMSATSVPMALGQGPGNIYHGAASAQWGNSFPAAYLWSGGKEAAVLFDMTPTTWMSASNLRRFWDVRANAFSSGSGTALGLQVVSRTGNSIPAGSMTYDFYLYSNARATQPTKMQAIDTMVRKFAPVHPTTANWGVNSINPSGTDWTTFAQGLSSNLMLQGIVTDDWNFAGGTVGSLSFEDHPLPADGTSPLSNYGWTQLTGYGAAVPSAWHPASIVNDFTSVNPLAAPASGSYVGFIQEPGGGAETPLGTIKANTAYTVTVAIGRRFAEGEGDWSIQLWAGGADGGSTFLNQTFSDQSGVNHPANGAWANNSVTWNSSANASLVGKNLFVRITNYSGSRPGTIFFDNVRVSGALGPALSQPWTDAPLFTENTVSTMRVSSDYAVGTGSSNHSNVLGFWDFSTSNNYLAPWVAYDRLNPDPTRHAFIDLKADDLPLFYDPNAGIIRWGTRYPMHIGDFDMSWQNFTFDLETVATYRMLAPGDFNPAIAGKFLMSLQGLKTFAHNVNYNFPQWFNPYQKVGVVQQDVPSLGVVYEPWQAGTYAWLMLQGYKITGDTSYVTEARAAIDRVLETLTYSISNSTYNITYSDPADFPITEIFGNAWGIAACQQLATITGDGKYSRDSDYFFDSLMRMSYWYESRLSADAADSALQNAGEFRNHGGAFTGSPWENIEAMLPMLLRLKNDAQPSELMLKLFNTHRINDFFYYPSVFPPAAAAPPSVMNSAANYVPIEDFHTYEQGNANGSLGRATYMSSDALWNYLLYEAFARSNDRDVMVLNTDMIDSSERALQSAQRNFLVYNPMSTSKSFTLTMKTLAAGSYSLVTADPLGNATAAQYSAAQLTAGIPMTLAAGDYVRLQLTSSQFASLDPTIQAGQGARDRISYAYQLLQQAATVQGVTPQLLQLKGTFNAALTSYGSSDYAQATSLAQQIIDALMSKKAGNASGAVGTNAALSRGTFSTSLIFGGDVHKHDPAGDLLDLIP